MGEFFKLWRRRIGVVTLGLACVFTAGWVRSEIISEIVVLPINIQDAIFIVSSHGRFSVGIEAIQTPTQPIYTTFPVSKIRSVFAGKETQWPSGLWPFDKLYGAHVPYWSIVIPLIVISFWLLLSRISAQEAARFLGVYFKPLRRKLGGATLLMACLFIRVWVKSQFNEVRFLTPFDNSMSYGVVSLHDGICLNRFKPTNFRGIQFPIEDAALLVIPHWSITIPLTLISLWLLLSKPRRSTPKKLVDRVLVDGT